MDLPAVAPFAPKTLSFRAARLGNVMDVNPRECMFCHDDLPVRPDEPVNMAFMAHLEGREPCRQDFDAWTHHMQKDYTGY